MACTTLYIIQILSEPAGNVDRLHISRKRPIEVYAAILFPLIYGLS